MKVAVFFIALLFNDSSPIEWRKLSWSDFRGESDNKGHAAGSATDLILQTNVKNGKFYFTVKAFFVPEKSFTITRNEKVLAHEQVHFDITELFARKLRKELKPFEGCHPKNWYRVSKIYDSISVCLNEMQVQYDLETEHSLNEAMQQKWINYISTQLQK